MANQNTAAPVPQGYGFEDDNIKVSSYKFGGNFGNCFLTKFEYNDHAGKDATEGEALDIVFTIAGSERNYRMFPVTKTFDENNQEVTDPTHPAFVKAQKNFNAICVQILKCFRNEDDVKASLAKRIASFKDFCAVLMAGLPKDFATKPLDIFLQWQWAITGENDKTYLEVPKKISYGKFVCAAVPAKSGEWTEVLTTDELYYIDATREQLEATPTLRTTAERHPYFVRNKWFVDSKFATQQREVGSEVLNTTQPATVQPGAAAASSTNSPAW